MEDKNINHETKSSPEGFNQSNSMNESTGFLGFTSQVKQIFEKYKDQIGLAILIVYVATLAIATIIELIEH